MIVGELMVGDLVLHDGKVIRVDAVHKRKIGYHKTKDKLTWLFSEQFEPIPLTPEILEKNGFENQGYAILELEDDCILSYYFHEYRLIKYYKDNIPFRCQCVYAHELQHALKLCGIDKEIIV